MQKYYDIIIVGAGPAGSMAALNAAKKGVSVLLLEKDRDIGYPVRCAEAVSKTSLEEFIAPDKRWIATEIHKFLFIAPDGTENLLEFEETGYVLERRRFDYELAKMAADAGAEVITRAYVNGLVMEGGKVAGCKLEYMGEQLEIKCKVLIAADGVESRVARWAGIDTACDFREMESCAQVTAGGIEVQPDTCYFYIGQDISPNGYLWVFPKGPNAANIGLGVSGNAGKKKPAIDYLNEFMDRKYPSASRLTSIAGGVPCCVTLKKISAPGILVAGDAARQVNPLTGGGICSGMKAGKISGTIAADAVLQKNPDLIFTYEKQWHKARGAKHEIYNRIKDGIFNFSDDKYNSIAASFAKVPEEKRSLGNLFTTSLLNNPSLLIDIAKVYLIK
jgi:digeranylgeranylglycerophospholipid reductase